jgi:hypothetical protein
VYQTSPSITISPPNAKNIAIDFNGGMLTSDAGVLLLQQVEQKIRLVERVNALIHDPRDPRYTIHQQQHLLAQRIFAIASGYEDVNDHKDLRKDPALLVGIKGSPDQESPLGSAPTLSRLENRITNKEIAEATKLFVKLFIESFDKPPKQLILDFDATDDLIHGNQEGKYFSGFYDAHCFLPLYVFCGTHLLWAQLRTCDKCGAHGALAIFHYLATELKKAFPKVVIIFRGDAGFSSPKLMDYCERHGHKYILGFSSNAVLDRLSANIVSASEIFFVSNGSKEPFRLYWEHNTYQAKSWKIPRRIIVKAERLPDKKELLIGKENTRYIVTNLKGCPQHLYEDVYCARGDMENRIKEQQLYLFADRTSCHDFSANRFRLLLSSLAYVLLETLRRTALVGSEMEKAQCHTIRERLFKIAARVTVSVRRILFSLPSSCPVQGLWLQIFERLRASLPLPSS